MHTAPGHGVDDTGQKNGLPVLCPVDTGTLTEEAGLLA